MFEQSHILVVTNNVIDKLTLKYTLCQEMKLWHCTDFISSLDDLLQQFKKLHEKSMGQTGYGYILLDLDIINAKLLREIANAKNYLATQSEVSYQPQFILISSDLNDKKREKKLLANGISGVLYKPITMLKVQAIVQKN